MHAHDSDSTESSPSEQEAQEPVSVYTVNDAGHAEIIKNMLRSEGIACELDGEGQAGLAGVFSINILVRAWDADRARDLILEHERRA
jgi:hypothetical protein